jgi:hypothetical protein
MATVQADYLSLPRRLGQARALVEEAYATLSGQVGASARPLKEACDAFSRVSAAGLRLVSTLQPFVRHDLLIAALVARGHGVRLLGGDAPHLVIDGVAASFEEAMAFHRGVVTLADIVEHGSLTGNAPDSTLP